MLTPADPGFLCDGDSVVIRAPVKINLALHVTGRRPDGYHLLESLVAFSPDGDSIRIEKADRDTFSINGPFAAAISNGGDNLVLKARDAWRAACGSIGPVAISLTKRLPVCAGIGGGSADAAATLAGLSVLARGPGAPELARCARPLGADVPMCLAGLYQKSALVARGIGEKLEMLPAFPALHLVLFNPMVAVATPAVFAGLENWQNPPLVFDTSVFTNGASVPFDCLVDGLQKTRNDLYNPARRLAPAVDDALETLRANGAALARMSGSGATCFGLYRSSDRARSAARQIAGDNPGCFVLATATLGKKQTG